jgi:C4-dicarboxylate-specific signal transduction histidine kinase
MNFKQKIVISLILFGVVSFTLSSLVIFSINKTNSINEFVSKASTKSIEREAYFKGFVDSHTHYLLSLKDSTILKKFVLEKNIKNLNSIFLARTNSLKSIQQLRLLDNDGKEIVKTIRNTNEEIKQALPGHLHDISDEYYFKESKNLRDGEVYYSKIDLAYEDCQTDSKDIPTLRIVTPIFVDDIRLGYLVLNVDIDKLLTPLSKTTLYNIYLIDKDGYYILHEHNAYDSDHNFARYKDKHNISKDFAEEYKSILSKDEYTGKTFYSKRLYLHNDDEIKMILEIKKFIVDKQHETLKSKVLVGVLLALILSLPFAYAISHYVDKIRLRLEKKVRDLNQTLEQRVVEEVEKNRQKEHMLLQQSKLAIMGEMISMIAHQWRQPLTSMKISIQSLKFKKDLGKLKDEYLDETVLETSQLIDHLSKTIDDFRDFFKPNKSKERVHIKDVMTEALGFLNHTFHMNGIKVKTDCKVDKSMYIYKRELLQVFMNILNNAKDALLDINPDTKMIFIKGREDDTKVTITIEDSAGGIPEDIIEKIFNPYFSTKSENGTGLGLYMSKVIIDTHLNGLLSVKNSDRGAVFTIELPIVQEDI